MSVATAITEFITEYRAEAEYHSGNGQRIFAVGRDPRLKQRIRQFAAKVTGKESIFDIPGSYFAAIWTIIPWFRLDENLQFPKKFREYAQPDYSLVMPVEVILKRLGIKSNSKRKRVFAFMRKIGLIKWETAYNFYGPGLGSKNMVRISLCVDKIWEILHQISKPLDGYVEVYQDEEVTQNPSDEKLSSHRIESEPIISTKERSQFGRSSCLLDSAGTIDDQTPGAAAPSGVEKIQEKKERPAKNQTEHVRTTNHQPRPVTQESSEETPKKETVIVRVPVNVIEITNELKKAIPADQFTDKRVKELAKLAKDPYHPLTLDGAAVWVSCSFGAPLPNMDPLHWCLKKDLKMFCEYWRFIARYLRACAHSDDAAQAYHGFKSLEEAGENLKNGYSVFMQCVMAASERGQDVYHLLYNACCNMAADEEETLVYRFMALRDFGQLDEGFRQKWARTLSQILMDCPQWYVGLKELGYPIDQWVQTQQRDFMGNIKKFIQSLAKKATLATMVESWRLEE